jgi:hypothetical protein
MAFALTAYKAWGIETNKAVTPDFIQYLEFTFTAANTDVSMDFGETGGTFWTAVGSGAVPAAAKAALLDICTKADYSLNSSGTHTASWTRGATAGATVYTEVAGTVTNSRNLGFNSGSALTAGKIVLSWKMKPESGIINASASV